MTATIAELLKEYMAKMPDTFDTKKEIDLYFKDGLDSIVMERKAAAKADKTAKAAEKFIEKAKKDEEKAEKATEEKVEKAKKPKKEIDEAKEAEKAKKATEKAEEKEAEKAKKAAEKAKKAAEKAAEKAKKAEEKEAEKAAEKASSSDTDDTSASNAVERKIFDDKMRIRIKEMFPDLNSKKTTKKIEELWKIQQDSIC